MRDQCIPLFKSARKELTELGLLNISSTQDKEASAELQKVCIDMLIILFMYKLNVYSVSEHISK